MRRAWLLGALVLAGGVVAQQRTSLPERCEDDEATCRETCTFEFGTDSEMRGKLVHCLNACASRKRTCAFMAAEDTRRSAQTDAGAVNRTSQKTELPRTEPQRAR